MITPAIVRTTLHPYRNFQWRLNCLKGPLECKNNTYIVLKNKDIMLNHMVSMATHNAILKNGGIPTKYSYLTSNSSRIQNLIPN